MPSEDPEERRRAAKKAAYARWAAKPQSKTRNAANRRRYNATHRAEIKAYEKAYRESHRERLSLVQRTSRYGMSVDEYLAMLSLQAGMCALCRKQKAIHIDHCHSTTVVRGLLCGNCNNGLGNFKDDVELLKAAILYLSGEKNAL